MGRGGSVFRLVPQGNRMNEKEFGVQAIRPTLRGGRDLFDLKSYYAPCGGWRGLCDSYPSLTAGANV